LPSLPSFFSPSSPSFFPSALLVSSRLLLRRHRSRWIRLRWERDWGDNWPIDSDSCRIPLSRHLTLHLISLLLSSPLSECPSLLPLSLRLPLNGPDNLSPMSSFPVEIAPTAEETRASRKHPNLLLLL
ncbi:hypothetical protein PMAYCL1PPCAC_07087, partial [Pristionchus mayeri]